MHTPEEIPNNIKMGEDQQTSLHGNKSKVHGVMLTCDQINTIQPQMCMTIAFSPKSYPSLGKPSRNNVERQRTS